MNSFLKKIAVLLLFCLLTCFSSGFIIHSEDVESEKYKIKDLSIGSAGGEDLSGSSGKRIMLSIGDNANDDRFQGTSYDLGVGTLFNWMATAPSIKCFAAGAGDDTSSCDDPDVKPDGMVEVCGDGGCYDRAHFELYNENNPSDTLYSIQITTDPAWATWNYVDASTFLIEGAGTHDINDYITESSWEAPNFNILGLEPGTTYYIRATALHGDFTESGPGPSANATTAYPQITFDIDIADTSGQNAETSAPYSVFLGTLEYNKVTVGSSLIWMDLGTNMTEGAKIFVRDEYSGLYSSEKNYLLSSSNANLDTTPGYGLQKYFTGQTYLGPIVAESQFSQPGNTVGGINNQPYSKPIFNTSTNPIYRGRCSLYIKARPSETTPPADDYEDNIIFTVAGDI